MGTLHLVSFEDSPMYELSATPSVQDWFIHRESSSIPLATDALLRQVRDDTGARVLVPGDALRLIIAHRSRRTSVENGATGLGKSMCGTTIWTVFAGLQSFPVVQGPLRASIWELLSSKPKSFANLLRNIQNGRKFSVC